MMRNKTSRLLRNANSQGRKKWWEKVYSNHGMHRNYVRLRRINFTWTLLKFWTIFAEALNDFRWSFERTSLKLQGHHIKILCELNWNFEQTSLKLQANVINTFKEQARLRSYCYPHPRDTSHFQSDIPPSSYNGLAPIQRSKKTLQIFQEINYQWRRTTRLFSQIWRVFREKESGCFDLLRNVTASHTVVQSLLEWSVNQSVMWSSAVNWTVFYEKYRMWVALNYNWGIWAFWSFRRILIGPDGGLAVHSTSCPVSHRILLAVGTKLKELFSPTEASACAPPPWADPGRPKIYEVTHDLLLPDKQEALGPPTPLWARKIQPLQGGV